MKPYLRFGAMILTSTLVMYGLTYFYTYEVDRAIRSMVDGNQFFEAERSGDRALTAPTIDSSSPCETR